MATALLECAKLATCNWPEMVRAGEAKSGASKGVGGGAVQAWTSYCVPKASGATEN